MVLCKVFVAYRKFLCLEGMYNTNLSAQTPFSLFFFHTERQMGGKVGNASAILPKEMNQQQNAQLKTKSDDDFITYFMVNLVMAYIDYV